MSDPQTAKDALRFAANKAPLPGMTDDLEQRVHALIYDADPEIPAAAVIAAVRAAVADEILGIGEGEIAFMVPAVALQYIAARIADPSRAK